MSAADKARATILAIEIPRDELAFRIMQKATGAAYMVPIFYAQADAAVAYFHECVTAARQPN